MAKKLAAKLEWTAAGALTALAVVLHVLRFLHAGGLWRDEAAAVGLATQPGWGAVFESFPHEAFPLLFPGVLRPWVGITGGGDGALRVLGLLVGLGLLAALWWNAWRLSKRPPLVSLALVGASPALFQLGDSVRGYGLGSLFLVLTFGAFAGTLAAGWTPTWRRVLAVLLPALGAVHCLIPTWPLLGALCVAAAIVLLYRREGRAPRRVREAAWVLGIGLLAALSLLPYAGPLSRAREWNVVVRSPSPVGIAEIWHGWTEIAGAPVAGVRWAWLVAAILALFGLAQAFGKLPAGPAAQPSESPEPSEPAPEPATPPGPERDRLLFALLAAGLAAGACFRFLTYLGYDPRPWYYLPLLVLLASAFDLLVGSLGSAPEWRLTLAIVGLLLGGALFLPAREAALVRQTNADLTAQVVEKGAVQGDLVLLNPWYNGISFARYYKGPATWLTLPEITDHRFHRYDLLKERMAAPKPIDGVLEAVGAALSSGHRVWVVGGIHLPRPGRPPRVLPPAPSGAYGWFDVPYEVSWSQETGAFLQAHATQVGEAPVPVSDPVSQYERLKVLVFTGWRF
jgi:hypothetical protein